MRWSLIFINSRIKRLASIKLKLELPQNMKMSQMQDLGGFREILKDIQELNSLVQIYKHRSGKRKEKEKYQLEQLQEVDREARRDINFFTSNGLTGL